MRNLSDPSSLVAMSLFKGLNDRELSRIAGLLHSRHVPAGTNVLMVEQPGEAVYLIESGTVKVHVEQPDGRDVILAILGADDILGEMSVADSLGRSATAITLEDSRLLWMDRAGFQRSLAEMPRLAQNLLRIMSRRLRLANARIQLLAALDVHGRVARQLLAFADEYGEPSGEGAVLIPFRLTQSDLADLVGASRVRVNQVLVDLRERGYVTVDSEHRITVRDAQRLAEQCR